jgi:hypothetical protein
VVAKFRINESGLKNGEVMNRRIRSERKGTYYPVPSEVKVSKELERIKGVDMIIYSDAPRP